MKKHLLFLFAAVALYATADAQIYHYYSYTPWDGDKLYSLNIGTCFHNVKIPDDVIFTSGFPIAAGLNFDGEKAVGSRCVFGYQGSLNYMRSSLCYTLDGDKSGYIDYQGKTLHYDYNYWMFSVEARLLFGIYFTDNIEAIIAAGVNDNLLNGNKGTLTKTVKATNVASEEPYGETASFSFTVGISALAGINYYFTDTFFASASLKANFPIKSTIKNEVLDAPMYSAMVGIGFKVIK